MTAASGTTLGIVGFGQFGRFMGAHLSPHFDVVVSDEEFSPETAAAVGVRFGEFSEVVAAEIVVLAVPLAAIESVLVRALPHITPNSVFIDVCSVKQEPVEKMARILPATTDVIGTHPLFGPQSGRDGIAGLRVAVCNVRGERLAGVVGFLRNVLGLNVLETSAEEHDREMAHVQALTHFVARALDELHVVDSDFATISYEEIMKAARLVSEDSWELFRTIQNGNPFAATKRRAFIKKLIELEDRLDER